MEAFFRGERKSLSANLLAIFLQSKSPWQHLYALEGEREDKGKRYPCSSHRCWALQTRKILFCSCRRVWHRWWQSLDWHREIERWRSRTSTRARPRSNHRGPCRSLTWPIRLTNSKSRSDLSIEFDTGSMHRPKSTMFSTSLLITSNVNPSLLTSSLSFVPFRSTMSIQHEILLFYFLLIHVNTKSKMSFTNGRPSWDFSGPWEVFGYWGRLDRMNMAFLRTVVEHRWSRAVRLFIILPWRNSSPIIWQISAEETRNSACRPNGTLKIWVMNWIRCVLRFSSIRSRFNWTHSSMPTRNSHKFNQVHALSANPQLGSVSTLEWIWTRDSQSSISINIEDENWIKHRWRSLLHSLPLQAVSTVIFIRFDNPASVLPHEFGLVDKSNADWYSSRRFFQTLTIIRTSPKNSTCVLSMPIFCIKQISVKKRTLRCSTISVDHSKWTKWIFLCWSFTFSSPSIPWTRRTTITMRVAQS